MLDPKFLRVACAQILHTPDQPQTLFDRHVEGIERAEQENIDLLVFPETSLTGYPAEADALAECVITTSDEKLLHLAAMCQTTRTVVGFAELGRGGLIYNSLAWLHKGKVLAVHRKINLPTYGRLEEGKYFAKGLKSTSLEFEAGWICGGLICADMWDPGLLYLAALKKCTVLAVPIASTNEAVGNNFSNQQGWDLVSQYSSMMYGLPVVRCNWAGKHLDMAYWGGSAVFGPDGKTICQAGTEEAFISTELSMSAILKARRVLPTLRFSSPDHVSRELRNLLG